MLYEIGGLGCCTRYVLPLLGCVALHSVLLCCVMILVAVVLSSPYVIFPLSTVCCVGDTRTFIHVLGFMLNITIPILPMMGVEFGVLFVYLLSKTAIRNFRVWCVGRGVLRFWEG